MPLRPLPFREVKRRLEAAGFVEHSQRGNHIKFVKQSSESIATAIVPNHREIAVGTPRSIIRQSGLSNEEFESL